MADRVMPPNPLPLFAPGFDPGPSFLDLLRHVQPAAVPGAGLEAATNTGVPHATTVVAIRCDAGCVRHAGVRLGVAASARPCRG